VTRRTRKLGFLLAGVVVVLCGAALHRAAAQEETLPTVLISRQLAAAEGLAVGDTILLSKDSGGADPRRFRVAGLYEPTPDPMRLAASRWEARMHLPDLLALAPPSSTSESGDGITSINVALTDPADADAFARDVSATIPSPELTVRPAGRDEESAAVFRVLDRFHLAIARHRPGQCDVPAGADGHARRGAA
jgi:hypothetical protein